MSATAFPLPPPPATSTSRPSSGEWVAVTFLTAVALALRLVHLGSLGLIADEGHQALAVRGVLAHGFPLVPSGNIYLRGVPFIYAEALSSAVAGVSEFALRLPAVIFGAAAVPLVFLYGRMLFGVRTGLVAAVLTTFSVWEVMISRYARMYTLLQIVFLGGAFFFYRGYLHGGGRRDRVLAGFLGAFAILTHELGIFFILLYAIPLFVAPAARLGGESWRRLRALAAPALLLAVVWFANYGFVAPALTRAPTAPVAVAGGEENGAITSTLKEYLFIPPVTFAVDLRNSDPRAILIAAVVAALAAAAVGATLHQPGRRWRAVWGLAIVGTAFLNLCGLALGLAAAYVVLLPGSGRDLRRGPLGAAIAGAALLTLYWAAYIVQHPGVLSTSWGEVRTMGDVLFGYPPFRSRVLTWLVRGWPLPSLIIGGTIIVLLARFMVDRRRGMDLFATAVLLLPLIAVTATSQINNESRYHFHLYPFAVTLFALALASVSRAVGKVLDVAAALFGRPFRLRPLVEGVCVTAIALFVSPDVAPAGLAAAMSRDHTLPRDPVRFILSWTPYADFHQDHTSTAAFVRARLAPTDLVLIAGPPYWASIYLYYIGRVDYVVSEHVAQAEPGVLIHHVSGARRITSVAALDTTLAAIHGRRLWILTDSILLGPESRYFTRPMKARIDSLAHPFLYVGRDLITLVSCQATAPAEAGEEPQ